jgi:murein L,D-transpeptidase YcbB/YkuD
LEDAKKLAGYLLKDAPSWTPGKIEQAMNSGKEQFVQVKKPVPVMITYFTTWVDQNGKLNFRSDVYNHDAKTRARMFGTTVALQQSPYIDSTHKDTTKNKI